jgi:hypothetical protein
MWGGFSGISSLRSHNSVQGSLSPRDLLVSLAQFRSRIPLSSGFRRFAHAIPFENSSLLGICSLRSHNSVQESLSLLGICSFHSHNSVQEYLSLLGICSFHSHNSVQEYLSPRDFVASLTQFRSRIPLSPRDLLVSLAQFRSRIPLSPRDLLVSLAQFRSRIPLSPGFRRFAPTSLPACGGAMQNTKKNGARVNSAPVSFLCFAEREGFEPSIRFWRTHAFQACLFSHSSISPWECKCSVFLGNNGI